MRDYMIRNAHSQEFKTIGELMVNAYASLEGFPGPTENPAYFKLLANVGELTKNRQTQLLIGVSNEDSIDGAVVYYGDMAHYGTKSAAIQVKNASGFRLLAVSPRAQGKGLGKLLALKCIDLAKEANHKQVIIHSTKYMEKAWKMYERIGFVRAEDFDFIAGKVYVNGYKLLL